MVDKVLELRNRLKTLINHVFFFFLCLWSFKAITFFFLQLSTKNVAKLLRKGKKSVQVTDFHVFLCLTLSVD